MSDRIYVQVNSDFDATGFVQPRSITWKDGRTFQIDAVRDIRPASSVNRHFHGDRYTVIIQGEVRYLFYERGTSVFAGQFGRWFVETA